MWPILLVNPTLIAVTVAIAIGCCRLGGVNPHGHEALLAVGVALAASTIGGLMLTIGRMQEPTPAGPSQASLFALVSHLGLVLVLSLIVLMTTAVAAAPFAYWVLGLFWVTLLGLSAVCVRYVRAAAARYAAQAGQSPAGTKTTTAA